MRFAGFLVVGGAILLLFVGGVLIFGPLNAYETGGDTDPPSADVGDVLLVIGLVAVVVGLLLVGAGGLLRAVGLLTGESRTPLTLLRAGVSLTGAALALVAGGYIGWLVMESL